MPIEHIDEKDPRGEINAPLDHDEVVSSINAERCHDGIEPPEDEEHEVDGIDFRSKYIKDGEPDVFNHRLEHPRTIAENEVTVTHNDPYLVNIKPIAFFGQSIKAVAAMFEGFKPVSGYQKENFEFEKFVELYQPKHGHTEGGKGLTFYLRPIVYQHCGMSTINCVNISYGCWDLTTLHNTVMTRLGPVPISNIITGNLVGMEIYTPEGWAPITKTFQNGEKDIYRVEDEDGQVYNCTADHPFMTEVDGNVIELSIKEIVERDLPILKRYENSTSCSQLK